MTRSTLPFLVRRDKSARSCRRCRADTRPRQGPTCRGRRQESIRGLRQQAGRAELGATRALVPGTRWDPLGRHSTARSLAPTEASTPISEGDWRHRQSGLTPRPPSQAGRRRFESGRPLLAITVVPLVSCANRRGPVDHGGFASGHTLGTPLHVFWLGGATHYSEMGAESLLPASGDARALAFKGAFAVHRVAAVGGHHGGSDVASGSPADRRGTATACANVYVTGRGERTLST